MTTILEDNRMTREEIQAKATEFKTNHPKYATIVQEIPNLDLKETFRAYFVAGVLQRILKAHARNLVEEKITGQNSSPLEDYMTEEEIKAKATEIKAKHPRFATVVEEIAGLDLKQTVKGYTAAEILQRLLKIHGRNLVE